MRFYAGLMLIIWLPVCAFLSEDPPAAYRFSSLDFFPPMPVDSANPVTVEGALLGRYLFYDPILSADSVISCASCHRQEAAFSDGPNRVSKGMNGALQARNTLPLFNLAWYSRLFWDGRAGTIEEHVSHPFSAAMEMNMSWPLAITRLSRNRRYVSLFRRAFGDEKIDSARIVRAIGQFERTLISANSRYDNALKGEAILTEDEFDGFNLVNDMTRGNCLQCHTTDSDALGTDAGFSNNGLDDPAMPGADKGLGVITGRAEDNGKFKVPSLRNLSFTAPYMHDGRFTTLEYLVYCRLLRFIQPF